MEQNHRHLQQHHDDDHDMCPTSRRSLKRKLDEVVSAAAAVDAASASSSSSPSSGVLDSIRAEVHASVAVLLSPPDRTACRRAAHILAGLAKSENAIGCIVDSGAVPVLVSHLQVPEPDASVPVEHDIEKASAYILGLLAVKPEYQQFIVDAGALTHLVGILKRKKDGFNSRAINGVIRRAADAITNLAHENSSIKIRVRMEGGIPPLVELLDSTDLKVQRAAAGGLRTLAFKNDENKNLIVQCNALPTLILMLRSEDSVIRYEAVGVIGNLVHSSPNIKKEVLLAGALQPVIGLLSSKCPESQREAALLLGQFAATDSDCKIHIFQRGAARPLIDMLTSSDIQLKEMAAFALGRLAQDSHNQAGIVYNGGLMPLLQLLEVKTGSLQHNAAFALYGLSDNEDNISDFIKVGGVQKLQDGEFIVQATKDCVAKTLKRLEEKIHGRLYLGDLYVNSPTKSDVIFLVEGKRFHAHRGALLASSEAFRAMFDGGYREKDARDVEIPNIRWEVFELMMRFIYSGSVEIAPDVAQDLLRAADQYLLDGLKRLCESTIAEDLTVGNVASMYELSEAFNAMTLRHKCVLFILEHFDDIRQRPEFRELIQHIIPEIRVLFFKALRPDCTIRL